MSFARNVSKYSLLAAAITCITVGTKLIETDLYAGIILILVGIALILIYAYLLEKWKQTVNRALKTLRRELEKGERKRHRESN